MSSVKSTSPVLLFITALFALYCIHGCAGSRPPRGPGGADKAIVFREIWGYLMQGEEKHIPENAPFTDICYFAASVNPKGRLQGAQAPPPVPPSLSRAPRFHLVVNQLSNPSLTHFCLKKDLPMRDALLGDMAAFSAAFHGIQVDFESVLPEDREAFLDFLSELKLRLGPGKTLGVALPPRRNKVADAYDYGAVAAIADRVFIMAYDEHWSTGAPGPVASLAWCREIASYAVSAAGPEKLVMGLPLYGRSWQDRKINRALRHRQAEEILNSRRKKKSVTRTESGLYIEYEDRVKVSVFYDDTASLLGKLNLYRSMGIHSVSFWRIGQGPPDIWRLLAGHEDR